MPFQYWQVGLDIQDHRVRALALQRRRQGWQLRHWWDAPLPPNTLRDGVLQQPGDLSELLLHWRRQLPRSISLRIAFPVQQILQHSINIPDQRLKEPERGWFIAANASRQFPLDSQSLVLDYRSDGVNSNALLLTAARRSELERWQRCLAVADLYPQAVDIPPCALQRMASAAGIPGNTLLVHRMDSGWLWVAPPAEPFRYGLLNSQKEMTTEQLTAALTRICPKTEGIACSGVLPEAIPEGMLSWSPLWAFHYFQPPLPACPPAFAVAGGLALRPEDG